MTEAKGFILAMLAETPLHPGAGQAAGVVDLPVAREGATGLPQVPETGLKGALRQWAGTVYLNDSDSDNENNDVKRLFGMAETTADEDGKQVGGAGELLISTARLLFLPVRRLDGAYAWVTTSYLLERLKRDADRSQITLTVPEDTGPDARDKLVWTQADKENVFLEEYVFRATQLEDATRTVMSALVGRLVADTAGLAGRLAGRAAIMHDDEFAWFAENALPVDARNSLADDTKLSENLWYEETLPPDTLLYAVILPRHTDAGSATRFQDFKKKLREAKYIQAGGNETVGHGWLRVEIVEG